jgi:hypothetical protein
MQIFHAFTEAQFSSFDVGINDLCVCIPQLAGETKSQTKQ